MRYKVGAEQLGRYRPSSMAPTPPARGSRIAAAGPTHAVSTRTGEAACGIKVNRLEVLDQDWEEAFFVERCSGCFAAVLADAGDCQDHLGRRHELLGPKP